MVFLGNATYESEFSEGVECRLKVGLMPPVNISGRFREHSRFHGTGFMVLDRKRVLVRTAFRIPMYARIGA